MSLYFYVKMFDLIRKRRTFVRRLRIGLMDERGDLSGEVVAVIS